ncbi:hypothetical protein FHS78_003662 [Parvibaculum indicum]|uniref:DUF1674 domain-containing protein n=1 Tax=Parvibaculum indicum TaxID=562969 RepID=UPI00142435D0|nr:DUF1674 domain-containing protein [Parvibaculum indicum]NIJ43348.1 hypothetical protein [Parvibaculum indicum]
MSVENPRNNDEEPENAPKKELSPAAQRALAEADARRKEADRLAAENPTPKEVDGRGGKDPARYGDWEVKGIISDF